MPLSALFCGVRIVDSSIRVGNQFCILQKDYLDVSAAVADFREQTAGEERAFNILCLYSPESMETGPR